MEYVSPDGSITKIYNEEYEAENAISEQLAIRIGKFVVAWGSLEHELEGFISTLFFIPPFQRIALTAGLALDAKVTQIQSGIGLIRDHLSSELKIGIRDTLNELRELNKDYRNFIFHWSVFVDSESQLTAGKLKGGNTPKVTMLKINEEYFDLALAKVAINRMYLRKLLNQLEHEVYPLKEMWLEKQAGDQALKRAAREEGQQSAQSAESTPLPDPA
jgi:hypothetical protein